MPEARRLLNLAEGQAELRARRNGYREGGRFAWLTPAARHRQNEHLRREPDRWA